MKKKILLSTFAQSSNFGTNLQAYALQKVIKNMGYDVIIYNGSLPINSLRGFIWYFVSSTRLYRYYALLKTKFIYKRTSIIKENDRMLKWCGKNFKIFKPLFNFQIRDIVEDVDILISGSDQVWNTFIGSPNPYFFLDFPGNKKKVSYASSIGTDTVNPKYEQVVAKWLSKYFAIGVREEQAVIALQRLTGRNDIVKVLDPTFLFTKEQWLDFAQQGSQAYTPVEPYIICYFIGNNPRYKDSVCEIVTKSKIKNIIIVPACENYDFAIDGAVIISKATPSEFVSLINNAAIVATDSFHATAISINLCKNFVELLRFADTDSASQNSRIYDLLKMFNLENRLVTDASIDFNEKIDYAPVQKKLEELRRESLSYLINAIES